MNREDIIAEISVAVRSVLTAQIKLHPEWNERIRQIRVADPGTQAQITNAYIRAIAEEMIKSYSDDELQREYI